MGLLGGRIALVTGAGRGIGRATAQLLAQEGARVFVVDVDADPAAYTVETIRALGGEAELFIGDVAEPSVVDNAIAAVEAAYGGLDILVNNAGFTWDATLHQMTDEQWRTILDVHLTAPFRLIRAAARLMRERAKVELAHGALRYRKIVNVSSASGLHGNVGQANYAAAKAGVIGLTKTVAKEWGRYGITCNAVAFGLVDTRLTQAKERGETLRDGEIVLGIPERLREGFLQAIPLGRFASPKDAAGAVLLLTLPWADYITGQVLEVNGGLFM